jgi:hypothetical protein
MRIVVNHLTRMRGGYVCVAGLDPETETHVRPVLAQGALPFDSLARYGGPFEMAAVVELGKPRAAPQTPHTEDHVIVPAQVRSCQTLGPSEFWRLLARVSRGRLREIFGDDLKRVGRSSCGTDVGRGKASLGCLRLQGVPRLYYLERGPAGRPAIRIRIDDGEFDAVVGVTDLRLYGDDHMTPCRSIIERVARRIETAAGVILGVGLTRAFAASSEPGSKSFHWLQATNIHLEDDPIWRLTEA